MSQPNPFDPELAAAGPGERPSEVAAVRALAIEVRQLNESAAKMVTRREIDERRRWTNIAVIIEAFLLIGALGFIYSGVVSNHRATERELADVQSLRQGIYNNCDDRNRQLQAFIDGLVAQSATPNKKIVIPPVNCNRYLAPGIIPEPPVDKKS